MPGERQVSTFICLYTAIQSSHYSIEKTVICSINVLCTSRDSMHMHTHNTAHTQTHILQKSAREHFTRQA